MRKTVLALFILLMVLPASARKKPRYPFVRSDLNVLQTPSGESPELQHFSANWTPCSLPAEAMSVSSTWAAHMFRAAP